MVDWILVGVMLTAIVAILIGLKFVKRWQRQKITQMGFCPPEILSQFDKAEKMFKESNGERDPHSILWEIANEERLNRMKGGNNGKESNSTEGRTTNTGTDSASSISTESGIAGSSSNEQHERRESISNDRNTGPNINSGSIKPDTPNYKRNFFSRFRRSA